MQRASLSRLIASWSPAKREESLSRALPIARAQKKLGLRVNVNANACMYRFFNGDERTAHVDAQGKPFWDESFDTRGRPHHMGCPFTLDLRKDAIREQVEPEFVRDEVWTVLWQSDGDHTTPADLDVFEAVPFDHEAFLAARESGTV